MGAMYHSYPSHVVNTYVIKYHGDDGSRELLGCFNSKLSDTWGTLCKLRNIIIDLLSYCEMKASDDELEEAWEYLMEGADIIRIGGGLEGWCIPSYWYAREYVHSFFHMNDKERIAFFTQKPDKEEEETVTPPYVRLSLEDYNAIFGEVEADSTKNKVEITFAGLEEMADAIKDLKDGKCNEKFLNDLNKAETALRVLKKYF